MVGKVIYIFCTIWMFLKHNHEGYVIVIARVLGIYGSKPT